MDGALICWDDSNTADRWPLRAVASCRPRMSRPRHKRGSRMAAVFLALALGSSAQAQPDPAFEAYERGDYVTALREWQPLAEQGNPGAQILLGSMYADGKGVPKDDRQAVAWYRKAAEQGVDIAQTLLGKMYASGRGVPQDDRQAVSWFQKAAEQG